MQAILLKLRTWWETADRTQRVVSLFGTAFLLLMVVGTFYFASRPKMEVLFRGLSPQDQGMIANELTKLGVAYDQDRAGNISVPSDKIADVQGKLAVAQKLPTSGKAGNADLDKMNIMNTPTVEKERLKVMQEGELARSIETIDGVKSARVHLTVGEQSPFAREQSSASASVIISESTPGAVSGESARAIQHIVQYAVADLPAKNITVVNGQGRTLVDGSETSGSGMASDRMQMETAEARRREARLQSQLDSVFGKGNTVVSIPVLEMNFDQRSESKNERLPTKPSSIEKNTETMGGGNVPAPAVGTAGSAGNTPGGDAATPATAESPKGYTGTQESRLYEVTETNTSTTYATGNLRRMAINVLVNSDKIKDTTVVDKAVAGELGPLAADKQNFKTTVTALAFDTTAEADSKKAEAAAAGAASKQQLMSLLPIIALVFVGFMVIKAIAKASKNSNVLVAALPGGQMMQLGTTDAVMIEVNGQQMEVAANSSLALEAAREGRIVGRAERKVMGGDATIDGSMSRDDRERGSTEFVDTDDKIMIAKIPEHINVPLEQLKKMANDRPEAVAMLLKSWLLSDGK